MCIAFLDCKNKRREFSVSFIVSANETIAQMSGMLWHISVHKPFLTVRTLHRSSGNRQGRSADQFFYRLSPSLPLDHIDDIFSTGRRYCVSGHFRTRIVKGNVRIHGMWTTETRAFTQKKRVSLKVVFTCQITLWRLRQCYSAHCTSFHVPIYPKFIWVSSSLWYRRIRFVEKEQLHDSNVMLF